MEAERWQQIVVLCGEALELPAEERMAFLRDRSGDDETLRAEAESLLAMAPESGLLDEIITTVRPRFLSGRYHLLQRIGVGGMGEVWMAEQREPVRRRVAIKLIKAGMNTREVIARFESERQALAMMDHPAIAKVFDAGSTPEGTPYFVMEYVAGTPITAYCDNHKLCTRERLELFIHVCEGVQHAHHKGIIHRDLKPSNILVAELDGRAVPKIIDFGVGKALGQKLTADTMFTRLGAMIGTPEYMSPEQANSSSEDIDTRTDVYSLGVVFYELLAGLPPLDLSKIAFEELLRRLREDEPPRPSTKIRTQDPATSTELARKRQTEPLALAKQMRGDLDSIALKALEKERSRRYGSPSDLAADIARYLNNEAVLAVAPSASYRARKFARRYRGALVTICAFVLVLIVTTAVSVRQSVRANKQRDRADAEAAAAQAINDFLQNDLLAQASTETQSGLGAKPDPHLEVRTALDRAAARIGGKFDRHPEVEAAIRDTIGQTYLGLGLYPEARTQLERARDLRRSELGAEDPGTLKTISRLGVVAFNQGDYPRAEALLRQTLEIQRRVLSPDHRDTLISMRGLASVYREQGKYPQADALDGEIVGIQRRVLGPEHRDTLKSTIELALSYDQQGKYAQAQALESQSLEMARRSLGPEDPITLILINDLANVSGQQGEYAQAEALHSQALEIRQRVSGPDHPDTLDVMDNLAVDYLFQGKFAQAEAIQVKALEIYGRVRGPEHPYTMMCMQNLASTYVALGKFAQAEALTHQTLEVRSRVLGLEHRYTLRSMQDLATTYAAEGKYAQAEAVFNRALEVSRRALAPDHPVTLDILSDFAFMYQRQGKYTLAANYASQALAGRRRALGSENPGTMASASDLALAYVSERKFAESEPLGREALEFNQKKQPDDWQRFRAESLLGASLAGQKKYAEAEPLLLEGYQGMVARKDRIAVPDQYHLDCAHEQLLQLYRAWGKPYKSAGMAK